MSFDPTPVDRIERAYERIAEVDRPEVWITLRPREEVVAEARKVEQRLDAGEKLPLAGWTLAVKDNIDVAGLPTTAGCVPFGFEPLVDASAVVACRAAGALVLGKTNLDQFATGLVGTRSPYGAVRDARDPTRVSGGSSSGSAVAVALGIADLGLGTDTAGSGRVPAAFQGIVGLKPTIGLVSNRGVVPACPNFDCVSVFASTSRQAHTAFAALAEPDTGDPNRRAWPRDVPIAAPPGPRIAVPEIAALDDLTAGALKAWSFAVERLRSLSAEIVPVDVTPILDAGTLLYQGALVAERYASVGPFIAEHRGDVDPSVAEIILNAGAISAAAYVADRLRLDALRLQASLILSTCDALLLPTAPYQPTIQEVARDPLGANLRLGKFTTCCNLLDMCAIALPSGVADGGQFGVSLLAPAFHDLVLADLASRFTEDARPELPAFADAIPLLVVGAHMREQPLNRQLTERGARFVGSVRTADCYRLYRLKTSPPKPGLARTGRPGAGAAIAGEVWALPPAGLASFLDELPAPMTLGSVTLEDGTSVVGFLCEPIAVEGAHDITTYGGWRSFLSATSQTS